MIEGDIKKSNEDYGYNLLEILRIFSRKKKLFFSTFVAIFLIGFISSLIERKNNPTFMGSFTLLVEDPFKKNDQNSNKDNFIEDIASYKTTNDIPSIIEVLKSRNLLEKISKNNNIKYDDLLAGLKISKGGNIKNIREEAKGILKVAFFGKDKNKISEILDDLSKEYLLYSLQQRQDRIKEGLKFLNSQNPGIKERLIIIQDQIEKLRTENNSFDPIYQSRILDESKLNFENKRIFLETQLNRLLKAKKDVENGILFATSYRDTITTTEDRTTENAQIFGLSVDYIDQGLLVELEGLKKKLADFKTVYTPDSEIIKSIQIKISKLEPKIRGIQIEAVESAISATKLKLFELKKNEDLNLKKYNKSISLIRKFDVLKQELDLAKENYNAFNSTKEKFRLSIAQNNFPWQLISYPTTSNNPIKPDLQKRFFQNLLISLLASSGLIILKDNIENYFHSSNEVKALLNKKILGSIPYLKDIDKYDEKSKENNLNNINTEELSRSEILRINKQKRNIYSFGESFKFLVNSLTLEKERNKMKIFNITSTIQGEGKTQTSVELAKMLNKMNKKTLLIDADLRKPKIHKRLDLNNDIGLSLINNYASNELKKLVQNVDKFENVSFITSGPIIDDPYKIFNSKKFEEFMEWLRSLENYEYIIFDSPQSLFIADTNLLNNKVDHTLLVVSLFKVQKDLVLESLNNINLSDGKVLGIVTINTKDNELIGYNYGVNSYTYGYGYNNYLKEKDNFEIFKNIKNFINNLM